MPDASARQGRFLFGAGLTASCSTFANWHRLTPSVRDAVVSLLRSHDLGGVRSVPAEEPLELGEDLDQEVLVTEVGESALLDLTVVAIGLDDADILVARAAGGPDFDGSEVHVVKYHDGRDGNQAKNWVISETVASFLVDSAVR